MKHRCACTGSPVNPLPLSANVVSPSSETYRIETNTVASVAIPPPKIPTPPTSDGAHAQRWPGPPGFSPIGSHIGIPSTALQLIAEIATLPPPPFSSCPPGTVSNPHSVRLGDIADDELIACINLSLREAYGWCYRPPDDIRDTSRYAIKRPNERTRCMSMEFSRELMLWCGPDWATRSPWLDDFVSQLSLIAQYLFLRGWYPGMLHELGRDMQILINDCVPVP